ncbi:MAG: hypothetical protein OXI55_08495 [Gammaproteobacteria bacterium]|nr:hypothetical protein [Gammaproteobacteria bacterium]
MWIRDHMRVRFTALVAATVAILASASALADSRMQSSFEQWAASDIERSYSTPTRMNAEGKAVPLDTKAIPVTHWRPWFVPRTPHPFDGAPASQDPGERKTKVVIKAVAASGP